MKDFANLMVWQKSHEFVLDVYRATNQFPQDERFGLTAHLRRSAISIASNIAEGCGRSSDADFARFMSIAAGSASQAEYQLRLAKDLGYLDPGIQADLNEKVNEVKKMLNAFIQTLSGANS